MNKNKKPFDQYEYNKKYHKENYYRMNIVITKDENEANMRDRLKAAAVSEGKSLNKFILDTLTEKLERMNK